MGIVRIITIFNNLLSFAFYFKCQKQYYARLIQWVSIFLARNYWKFYDRNYLYTRLYRSSTRGF